MTDILNGLSEEEIAAYSATTASEPHIVIGPDRFITVPSELKRIAVQYDHNIETVTFDCPRYWDNHDMSTMFIYINYMTPNGIFGSYTADNVAIDETDSSVMHFTWTITRNVTQVKGNISFLVCIKNIDSNGKEINHWNSELNRELFITEGLEGEQTIIDDRPDLITQMLLRINNLENDKGLPIISKTDLSPFAYSFYENNVYKNYKHNYVGFCNEGKAGGAPFDVAIITTYLNGNKGGQMAVSDDGRTYTRPIIRKEPQTGSYTYSIGDWLCVTPFIPDEPSPSNQKKIGYTKDCDYRITSNGQAAAAFKLAIREAKDGDTIIVMPGQYSYINSSDKIVSINKNISFVGVDSPTIDFDVSVPVDNVVEGEYGDFVSYTSYVTNLDGLTFNSNFTVEGRDGAGAAAQSTASATNCIFNGSTLRFSGTYKNCVIKTPSDSSEAISSGTYFGGGSEFYDCYIECYSLAGPGSDMFTNCDIKIKKASFAAGSSDYMHGGGANLYNCTIYLFGTGTVDMGNMHGGGYDMKDTIFYCNESLGFENDGYAKTNSFKITLTSF